jgi:amidase
MDANGKGSTLGRRAFLERSAGLGVAAVFGLDALGQTPRGRSAASPSPSAFELDEATVAALQDKMKSGALSARRVTQAYLDRIAALDRKGPMLRSVIETNPDALAEADALDAERKAKGPRGPLHGIPILVKDNVDTAGKMTTTAGSLALEGSIPEKDAFLVARLREAGVVLLGKANLSEWANFRSTRSSSGWSARGGQCKNPYVLDRNPCGSSSGSGAAVAANLCAIAVGTETDGSIVCPSTTNGIVGIKPTVGLVSRAGVIPISHSQDTAGPMARTVADAALLLAAMAGRDPKDAATSDAPAAVPDYARSLDPQGLRGARIGVSRNLFGFSDKVDKLMEDAIAEMKRQGAVVVDPADIPNGDKLNEAETEVLLYEFKADLNAYLAGLGPKAPVKTLEEAIAFNEKNRDREMPFFGQELFLKAQEKGPLTTPAYQEAFWKCRRYSRTEGIDAVIDKHQLDAVLAPTGGPSWTTDHVNGDHFTGGSSSSPAVAGYPSVTVPAGFVFGLPVGLSFIGKAWSEATLIKLAYAYEQATRHRRAPKFLATFDAEKA